MKQIADILKRKDTFVEIGEESGEYALIIDSAALNQLSYCEDKDRIEYVRNILSSNMKVFSIFKVFVKGGKVSTVALDITKL